MKLFKQASAVMCAICLFTCSGCKGSIGFTPTISHGPTGWTFGGSGNFTWQFGSQDEAQFMAVGDPTSSSYTFVESVPSVFTSNSSSPPQITMTATTDNGYTSSITLALQSTSTTVAPVNQGDVVYAWTVPASAALTTWEQNLNANTTSQISISFATSMPFAENGTTGTFPITTIVQTPIASATASSSAIILPGPSGPSKCPGNPSCPVPVDPGE